MRKQCWLKVKRGGDSIGHVIMTKSNSLMVQQVHMEDENTIDPVDVIDVPDTACKVFQFRTEFVLSVEGSNLRLERNKQETTEKFMFQWKETDSAWGLLQPVIDPNKHLCVSEDDSVIVCDSFSNCCTFCFQEKD